MLMMGKSCPGRGPLGGSGRVAPGACAALALTSLAPPPSSLALWGLSKKRPLALQREAHGLRGAPGLEQPFWVSSVAALLNTDLVASGERPGR